MLSRVKLSHFAAAATLAILMGMPAVPDVAAAQDREVRRDSRDDRRDARQERREGGREARQERRGERGEARRDRNDSSRVVIRSGSNDRSRVVIRDRDRDWRHAGRSFAQGSAFVVLGPRTVYRDYGPNWCRGLHRGRHFDRRNGWHAGRHYGPYRC